jgi:plastocyanin
MRAMKKGHVHVPSLRVWLLAAVTAAAAAMGCGSSSNNPPDGGGGAGGYGGQGGHGGQGGLGGQDAASGFMAFAPCASASAYVSNTTQIAFGGTLGLNYSPACLQTTPGATITFSGDFATHPLIPSTIRITQSSNPIVMTTSGTTASFIFNAPGFYGYFCGAHGDDQGDDMSGVIWVE